MIYGFYPGCTYQKEAVYKESVESVNQVIGLELKTIEDWNCCGATSVFSVDETDALLLTGRIFALANQQGMDSIITNCNACYTSLRKASKLFHENKELIAVTNEQLSAQGLEISSLPPVRHLLDVYYNDIDKEIWSKNRPQNLNQIKVAAYYGCQITRPWADIDDPEHPMMLDLFLQRLGFETVNHSAKTLCCGASHVIAYEDDCLKLNERIIKEIKRKGGQLVSTICPLCQMNLDASQNNFRGAPLPVPYFTQLAGLALGIDPDKLGIKKLLVSMDFELKQIL